MEEKMNHLVLKQVIKMTSTGWSTQRLPSELFKSLKIPARFCLFLEEVVYCLKILKRTFSNELRELVTKIKSVETQLQIAKYSKSMYTGVLKFLLT